MDFEFSEEERAFLKEVDEFLCRNYEAGVMDPFRENFAQLVDTPERRAFMRKIADRGWLGMTWPKEYGGGEKDGVYEYLLNERLAGVGAPQIGKGVGIIGKTLIRHGSEKLKREFLPKILVNEVEFAIGYSEPQAGSDAAAMQLKAVRNGDGWILNGSKIFTTSAHFAEWYWVGARTDPAAPKHAGIKCSSTTFTSATTIAWASSAAGSNTSPKRSTWSASPCSRSRRSRSASSFSVTG
jgi:hypothetical protein